MVLNIQLNKTKKNCGYKACVATLKKMGQDSIMVRNSRSERVRCDVSHSTELSPPEAHTCPSFTLLHKVCGTNASHSRVQETEKERNVQPSFWSVITLLNGLMRC